MDMILLIVIFPLMLLLAKVPEETIIAEREIKTTIVPVGSNLNLDKEYDAYTYILKEFNLI